MVGTTTRSVHALQGHTDKVWSVAFSPDGRSLISAGEDRSIIRWDVATMAARTTYLGHRCGVNTAVFAPQGDLIVSGGEEGTVRLWRTVGKGGWSHRRHRGGTNQVAFSPDGRLIASVGGLYGQPGQVRLSEVTTGYEVGSFDGHRDEVMTVAFSPSGHFLVTGDFAGDIKLWDVATGEERMTIPAHLGVVWKVAFVDNDHVFLSAGEDGRLRFWIASSGQPLSDLPDTTFGVLSFAWARDGRLAVGCYDGAIFLSDLHGTGHAQRLGSHGAPVFSVAFAPDGSAIASAGADGAVRLWQFDIEPARRQPFSESGVQGVGSGEYAALR